MALKAKKVRIAIRWIHLILGVVVLCYVYSPFHEYVGFQIAMKFLIIPIITITGIWIWQFKAVNRFFRIDDGP